MQDKGIWVKTHIPNSGPAVRAASAPFWYMGFCWESVRFFIKSWVSGRRKSCKPACHAGLQDFNQYGSMLGFDMGKCVEMA